MSKIAGAIATHITGMLVTLPSARWTERFNQVLT